MKIIAWIVRIIILLMLVWLALQNTQDVTFSLTSDLRITLPFIAFIFGFFGLGMLMGVLLLLPKHIGVQWEARRLRKENAEQGARLAQLGADVQDPVVDVPPTIM